MDPRRLRAAVTIGTVALTAGVAVAVAADPLPGPSAPVSAVPADPMARLAAREERAAYLLAAAERRVRSAAAAGVPDAPAPVAVAAAPQVAVAPAPAVPVTSSGSS